MSVMLVGMLDVNVYICNTYRERPLFQPNGLETFVARPVQDFLPRVPHCVDISYCSLLLSNIMVQRASYGPFSVHLSRKCSFLGISEGT